MTYQFFHFIVLVLATIYVVTQSNIFSVGRVLFAKVVVKLFPSYVAFYAIQLIYCPACFGFWVGLAAAYRNVWPGQSTLEAACFTMLLGVVWSRVFPDASHTAFTTEIVVNDDLKVFAETIGLRPTPTAPVHDHYSSNTQREENWR